MHGGALANVMFCKPGTFVFELGFSLEHTQHYAHLSRAMDLTYRRVSLESDERGVASPHVRLSSLATMRLIEEMEKAISI